MDRQFHEQNRSKLWQTLPEGAVALSFAGMPLRQSADEFFPFFCDRNFLYLTGCDNESFILLAAKSQGEVAEAIYILPPDPHAERWNGARLHPEQVQQLSGIEDIRFVEDFPRDIKVLLENTAYTSLWLDLDQRTEADRNLPARRMAAWTARDFPRIKQENLLPALRRLRTIKQPCEIEAMRRAEAITGEGILAMMKACRPGMYEYQLKAEFDRAISQYSPYPHAFRPIVSSGDNNFCIHYYGYTGLIEDGHMILNDVGARWDNINTDVSRGWPANGRFNERQRALYECAYNTSNHMFSIIRPGMPMLDVDRLAREYNYELLHELGLVKSLDEVGKLIWHGGSHHVGWDVHDVVEYDQPILPGMVFCVDIGIYCQEWGIGFRLEDNCLVTENGCENLSAAIPRSIEDIEAVMK